MSRKFATIFFLILSINVVAQVTVSGHVKDKNTGEPLIGALVRSAGGEAVAVTDNAGHFSLYLPNTVQTLCAEYLGYATDSLPVGTDRKFFFKLSPGIETKTIEVVANKDSLELRTPQTGRHELNLELAKSAPMVLGEPDIMKSLQYLPGVKGTMEGGASFSVRGGNPDQNLIIYDGVPVYNTNHAFGLFSIFQTESIKKVVMYKSGFPSRFGERLSSIIDISMKDGNMKAYHAQAMVSNIAASLFYEGPIVKDKLSLVVAGRRSYLDVFLVGTPDAPKLYFYDFSSKLTWRINDRIKLAAGIYNGDDKILFIDNKTTLDLKRDEWKQSQNAMNWGNNLIYLKGSVLHNDNSVSNLSLFYSQYRFSFFLKDTSRVLVNDTIRESGYENTDYATSVADLGLRYDWSKALGAKHQLGLGGGYIYHRFQPDFYNQLTRINGKLISYGEQESKVAAHEAYAYLQDEWQLHRNLVVNIGLRGSVFKSDSSQWYANLEPRASVSWLLGHNQSLKSSAMLVHQYVHLLSISSLSLPLDAWVPVTNNVKPGKSYQFDLAYERIMKGGLKFTVSVYYKVMKNTIDQNPNESFLNFRNWENKVAMTDGNAYGAEFFLEKTRGRLTGSLAYTLAWSNRKYQDPLLNNGAEFRYRYDRRHDLSLLARWQIGAAKTKANGKVVKKFLTGSFVLSTGNLHSIPTGVVPMVSVNNPGYFQPEQQASASNVFYLDKVNNYEAPISHRLDLAYAFEKQNKKTKVTWSFGLFNAYNHLNTFALKLVKPGDGLISSYQIRQYGTFPVLPFISFKIDFNSSTPTN